MKSSKFHKSNVFLCLYRLNITFDSESRKWISAISPQIKCENKQKFISQLSRISICRWESIKLHFWRLIFSSDIALVWHCVSMRCHKIRYIIRWGRKEIFLLGLFIVSQCSDVRMAKWGYKTISSLSRKNMKWFYISTEDITDWEISQCSHVMCTSHCSECKAKKIFINS